jgi:Spy/CpxP family protein refolding chaperone
MRNKGLGYLTVLVISLLTANSHAGSKKDGEACPHGIHKEWHGGGHFMHKMTEQLDLSEDQQQQLKALHEEDKTRMQSQHEALRENHEKIHGLITSGDYTEDKASQLAEQQGTITAEMAKLRAAHMAKLYALLTPEQQKKFSTMKFEHKVRHKDAKKKAEIN